MKNKIFFGLLTAIFIGCGSNIEVEVAAGSVSGTGGEGSSVSSSSGGGEGGKMDSSSSSSSVVTSSSSGMMFDPYAPCVGVNNEEICEDTLGNVGFCLEEVCLLCGPSFKLDSIVESGPCYEFICKRDPGAPGLAYPTVNYHLANEKCFDQDAMIDGTCSEDGQCCDMEGNCGKGVND